MGVHKFPIFYETSSVGYLVLIFGDKVIRVNCMVNYTGERLRRQVLLVKFNLNDNGS